ncbi:vWA-MoxR associated conflict system protein [Streptomyces lincolnensis]|uniref:vWA-MoxR associated conflict system protein n=1 Tax=Streptomyces lincolnensis TaxID=1915 RepID=UPI0037D2DC9D
MTPPAPPRHLLVIAPQCPDQGMLDGLEDTARSLHAVLLDPAVGGCEEPPSGLSSLLCGPDVMQTQVEKAVRDAAERAGEAGAVLVLAFVGHGTTPGDAPQLMFMASDSRADARTTVVNLSDLLAAAVDTPGVRGVVALVDTCRAGGAVPDLGSLAAGVRGGAVQLAVLMSVGVTEDAYGLAFTRGVVRLLREGLPGAGEFLTADDVQDAVDATAGTGARVVTANGDSIAGRVWFARNIRHTTGHGPLLGPVAEGELRWALEPLGEAVPTTRAGLERLREILHTLGTEAGACALRVTDALTDVLRTAKLLQDWPGSLTSDRLRRAFTTAAKGTVPAPRSCGGELLRDCVEALRLRAPRVGDSRMAPTAAFVAALAAEDRLAASTPELAAWANETGAVVELNDAFARLAERSADGRLRLVVSLHAAVADDWPEALLAWLLDGEHPVAHEEFGCPPTQAGVEQALFTVLTWAKRQARTTGCRLRQVDIAAPTALLASWRPEETKLLGPRLGVSYDIVLRWSDRLCPPAHLDWINDYARDRLDATLHWLGEQDTGNAETLADRLADGAYDGALALGHRPDRLTDVLEPLLAYAPKVLWPQEPGDLPDGARQSVARHWDRMPGELSAAYRSAWRQPAAGQGPDDAHPELARLRSAWHDRPWLDFCDWFDTR